MREPIWIRRFVVEILHHDDLSEHGGLLGLRDASALESALGRPRNKFGSEEDVDLAGLAAAYAFGIARNHPFNDGNKRVALAVMLVFLERNGATFDAPAPEILLTILSLAAGELTESKFAAWIRAHLKKRRRST